ncbi:Calcineurin subunit B [Tritrichomonas foetus]|uniref:Calcineurin subunit B n=1 Tax=Tritrichomonas foetus TaxID=1144522 RepID=A0A1J4JIS4_9EUKA|nr:Calcineurin subunit B [Tritrichomonas foetus]|eukprot:OHS97459.1 Calcineurin subunit B [Tritrichomonas foetus]
MGNKESIASLNGDTPDGPLTPEKMQEFTQRTQFSPKDIQHLLLVYRKIGGSTSDFGDGKIDEEEFLHSIKFSNEKIGRMMYQMLDTDGDHSVDFDEFVYGLNTFHPNAELNNKIVKCFKVYDSDGSGNVSKDEIKDIINISLENNTFMSMDEAHLDQLVDDLFEKYDTSGEDDMSLTDFTKMITCSPGILDAFEFDVSMLPTPDELKHS